MRSILQTDYGSLYEGDCIQIMSQLPSEAVDLIFADPPFNLGKQYTSNVDDNISENEYLEWCYKWIKESIRVLKVGGSFFIYNLPKWNIPLGAFLMNTGMTFRHWIAIDMKYTLPIPKRLYPSHYSLLYYTKGKVPSIFHPDRLPLECCRNCGKERKDYGGYKSKMNPNGVNITDVWEDIPPVRHSKYKTREANQLSLKLMDRIISMASDEGSLILDPFGGSGTTYITAELLNRRWIGMELDCTPIIERFQTIETERSFIQTIYESKNTLFTEKDLKKRFSKGEEPSGFKTEEVRKILRTRKSYKEEDFLF